MKKKNRLLLIAFALLTCFTIMFCYKPIKASADVGNSVSHSHSNSGFSKSHSSSGFSHSGSGFSSSFGSRYSFVGIGGIGGGFFVIVAIILFIYFSSKKGNKSNLHDFFDNSSNNDFNNNFKNDININTGNNNLDKLRESDHDFSEQNLIMKVNNMYMQLQNAWSTKKWKSMRAFETDELFNQHEMQLKKYIDSNTTNVVDNICILETKIEDYKNDGVNDVLSIQLRTRINDYIIDDNTKKVVSGEQYQEIYMTYIWKIIRKSGVKTNLKTTSTAHCPNCGASIDSINHAGVCEYCGSVITKGDFDWVLSEINVLDQM